MRRLEAFITRWQDLLASNPFPAVIYLALITVLVVSALIWIARRRADLAIWSVIGIELTNFSFSWGHDTEIHIYRIVAIAEQLRAGGFSLLLVNPVSGEAVPTLLFYSPLPYLVPVALYQCGLSAIVAFKLSCGAAWVAMGCGVRSLVLAAGSGRLGRGLNPQFLIAILFLTANYVYVVWRTRHAYAELMVYAAVPWVSRWLLAPGGGRPLLALFFVQAATHPIVLAHALIAEVGVAIGLSSDGFMKIARRCLVPFAGALLLSAPFWAPIVAWRNDVLGPAALPVAFADSFLTLGELFSPGYPYSTGVWIPLAVAMMLAAVRLRPGPRVWLLSAGAMAIVMIQTTHLQGVVARISIFGAALFIWRLMFPAAFLASGALLAGWRSVRGEHAQRGLALLAALSVLGMTLSAVRAAPSVIPLLATHADGVEAFRQFNGSSQVWGVREFEPQYARLETRCPSEVDLTRVSYDVMRSGVTVDRAFLAVRKGPIGMVKYELDGAVLNPSACGDDLILGPLQRGGSARASEASLDLISYLRVGSLMLCGVLLIVRVGGAARAQPPQARSPWASAHFT